MDGPLDLFEQFSNAVETEARPKLAEITRSDGDFLSTNGSPISKPTAQRFVDHILE